MELHDEKIQIGEEIISDAKYICPLCQCESKYIYPVKNIPYQRCNDCQHEFRIAKGSHTFIINEILDADAISKKNLLDHFFTKTLKAFSSNNKHLIDIGSGSGRFLFHNKMLFKHAQGLEVTPECIRFCRDQLQLDVVNLLEDLQKGADVITAWHSLEHIEIYMLGRLLEKLHALSSENVVFIVSVPNANATLYKLLRKRFAYYDPDNHVHTFSKNSLQLLFGKYGYTYKKTFHSLPYEIFGAIQTLLNFFNTIHNFFYYRRKRGFQFDLTQQQLFLLEFYNIFLILFLSPMWLLLAIYGLAFPEKGCVITIAFEK
jgi:2-polyprenyl-3-methyl-5-hydroxy-6-metoxy-1,4-benzoquinol methylase